MQDQITAAIRAKKLLEVVYETQGRTAEPHVLGTRGENNNLQVLAYELRNYTDFSPRPGWRYYLLSKIEHLRVLDIAFPGRRPGGLYQDTQWKRTIAIVDP